MTKSQKNLNVANAKELEVTDGILEEDDGDEEEEDDSDDDDYGDFSDIENDEEDNNNNNINDDFNEIVDAAETMATLIEESGTTIEELIPFLQDLYKDYQEILDGFVTNFKYFSALYPAWKNILSIKEEGKTQEKINSIAVYQRLFTKYAVIQKRLLSSIGKFTELQTALLPYSVFPCEISKDQMTEAFALAAKDDFTDSSSEGAALNS